MSKVWGAIVLVALSVTACASADDPSPDPSSSETSSEVRKGCVDHVMCVKGYTWSSKTCSCVRATPTHKGSVSCGKETCGAGEYCCSSSCGICEKVGAMCPAIACANPI